MSERSDAEIWIAGLDSRDWLIDGRPIRGQLALELWDDLDWAKAWVDMGPSIAGNPGPYWHVPRKGGETAHRLYPKILQTKWLPVIRRAIDDAVAQDRKRRDNHSASEATR